MVEHSVAFSLTSASDERADKLLSVILGVSRNRIQQNILLENVLINGAVLIKNSFSRFRKADTIEIEIEPLEALSLEPENIPLNIIFENDDFLIVNKQHGLVVHPAVGHPRGTMMNGIIFHLNSLAPDKDFRPGLPHRIDKDTTGLLVVAKTREAFEGLVKKFSLHDIKRRYCALVWGKPKDAEGRIETSHGRDPRNRLRFSPHTDSTRKAVTNYRVVAQYQYISELEITLETGRTHQIRMHMSHIGHPVVNDELYSGLRKTGNNQLDVLLASRKRQMLHARELGFELSGKEYSFLADIPMDMAGIISFLSDSL